MEHYWGYCQKTRTYFDLHVDNWGCKNTNWLFTLKRI
jgi:hypothetical protein